MGSEALYATATQEVTGVARDINFMVRLTEAEKELLDALARRLGETRSVVLRRALRDLARREGLKVREAERADEEAGK